MTLKLLALDDEDLTVISAHMQDAVSASPMSNTCRSTST